MRDDDDSIWDFCENEFLLKDFDESGDDVLPVYFSSSSIYFKRITKINDKKIFE